MASFTGIVRGEGGLAALRLDHYPAMTERAMTAIAEEAAARWPLLGLIADPPPSARWRRASGSCSSAPRRAHRAAALEACAFLIDWLKTKAPFWKQETLRRRQRAAGSSRARSTTRRRRAGERGAARMRARSRRCSPRWREGDRAAFATLYARTSAKLYGTILRILPEGGQAEDALQDVYARIWHIAGGYDAARGRPITWLAAIARNRAIDILRSERGARRARIVDVDAETLAAIPDEHRRCGESAALAQCLAALDPVHRECILLAYLHGASREELAARFDRPTGTIKSWLSRGLALAQGVPERWLSA